MLPLPPDEEPGRCLVPKCARASVAVLARVKGKVCGWACDLHLERWQAARVRAEVEGAASVPDALRWAVQWAAGEVQRRTPEGEDSSWAVEREAQVRAATYDVDADGEGKDPRVRSSVPSAWL